MGTARVQYRLHQVLICELFLSDTHCCIPPQVHFSWLAPYRQDLSAQSTPGVSSSTRIKILAARTPAPPPPRATLRRLGMSITMHPARIKPTRSTAAWMSPQGHTHISHPCPGRQLPVFRTRSCLPAELGQESSCLLRNIGNIGDTVRETP